MIPGSMSLSRLYGMWVLCFALVLACTFWPRAGAQPPANGESLATVSGSLEGLPYRGVAIQIQRTDWIDKYIASIDEIADLGADLVSLVIDTRMENGQSNRVWLDMRMTPTPDQVGKLIDHAKGRRLRVLIMPIVLLDEPIGNEWRGTIKPESWDKWFDSYRAMLYHFAWIAEQHHADVLSVGSELVSAEDKAEQWKTTIAGVRKIFTGKLTYSANWDHYESIPFWRYLDLVGMNSYWKLGNDRRVTIAEIQENWAAIQRELFEFQRRIGKPFFFTEVGWHSLANAAHEPWDYTKASEEIDLDLQRRLYEGFFESWYGNPNLGGFVIWEWPPDQGGPDNRGYIPKGKPAEQVLRAWFSKPRWKVTGQGRE